MKHYLPYLLLLLLLSGCSNSTSDNAMQLAAEAQPTRTPVPTWTPTSAVEPLPSPTVVATESATPTATPTTEPILTPTPTLTSTSIPEAEAIPTTIAVDSTSHTAANQANLRSGPGTNYTIVGQVQQGEQVQIVARTENADWYQVGMDNGDTAWIAAFLIEEMPDSDLVPIALSIPEPPPASDPAVASSPSNTGNPDLDSLRTFSAIANAVEEAHAGDRDRGAQESYEIFNNLYDQYKTLTKPDNSYGSLMSSSFGLYLIGTVQFHFSWCCYNPNDASYYMEGALDSYGDYLTYRYLYVKSLGITEGEAGFKE